MNGYAVLTGDIVSSSELTADELSSVMTALDSAAQEMSAWSGTRRAGFAKDGGFARRGGDSWQIVLEGVGHWLRAALYVQAVVRRLSADYSTRIAIAESSEDISPTAWKDPNVGHGPAFTASGRLLTKLGRDILMGHAAGGAKAATIRLADEISRRWTNAQARTLCEALPPKSGTRKDIAARLGISREAVNQAIWSSGFLALKDAIVFTENAHD